MAQVLVRDLDSEVIERLKSQAKRHGRSLQGEVKAILEGAVKFTADEARQVADAWHQRLAGRTTSDSGDLIREDRDQAHAALHDLKRFPLRITSSEQLSDSA